MRLCLDRSVPAVNGASPQSHLGLTPVFEQLQCQTLVPSSRSLLTSRLELLFACVGLVMVSVLYRAELVALNPCQMGNRLSLAFTAGRNLNRAAAGQSFQTDASEAEQPPGDRTFAIRV